jgi:hypothetical protein
MTIVLDISVVTISALLESDGKSFVISMGICCWTKNGERMGHSQTPVYRLPGEPISAVPTNSSQARG